MTDYVLRCETLEGRAMITELFGFGDLSSALDELALWACDEVPAPSECRKWELVSVDGLEMAARCG